MGLSNPRAGEAVCSPCFVCKRDPRAGETYGPHAEGWDFTGICPECWDRVTAEPDEPDQAELEALEREAVEETFGSDGAFYEEATGKTLGQK